MKKSRTDPRATAVESPRHLPLVDLLVDARTELFELAVRSGLRVLAAMLEEDRTALCGARYAHVANRGQEVPLPILQAMADADPLDRRVVEQMLVGVATRRYARSLDPAPRR